MTKIYLIRHAEAEGNIFRRMDGHYDSRITPNGYRQIAALQERFCDVPIDAVYASDLFRTRETAKALYVPKGLPLRTDARFRELWFGDWEDVSFGWIDCHAPKQLSYFSREPERWNAPNAERYPQAAVRFWDGLKDAAQANEGRTVAVFSHGGITGWSLRAKYGDRMHEAGRCDNTGVCLLRWENGDFIPEYFYSNAHLSPEISTLEQQRWWRGTTEFNLWFRDPLPEDAALFDPAVPPVPGHVLRIAMRMEEPVGYLSYDPETAFLSSLYLIPAMRGRRRGAQLLGEAVCACRALGHPTLHTRFPADNACAGAFFTRHGAELQSDPPFTAAALDISLPQE